VPFARVDFWTGAISGPALFLTAVLFVGQALRFVIYGEYERRVSSGSILGWRYFWTGAISDRRSICGLGAAFRHLWRVQADCVARRESAKRDTGTWGRHGGRVSGGLGQHAGK